jgi:hypothetical protein
MNPKTRPFDQLVKPSYPTRRGFAAAVFPNAVGAPILTDSIFSNADAKGLLTGVRLRNFRFRNRTAPVACYKKARLTE